MRLISKARYFFVLAGLLSVCTAAAAQGKTLPPASPSSCSREGALEIIQQQIDLSKTFDDDVRRIAVLLRAADLIWPYQQDKARTAFTDAFDVASRNFKEKGDNDRQEGRLTVGVADQRYTVITAIAKRDPDWARKLSKRILDEDAKEAQEKASRDTTRDARTESNLLVAAISLLSTDQTTAVGFARTSLTYPATIELPIFLFKFTAVNNSAADQFYQEALNAYAHAPMEQFLYLSSYPFASRRELGEMPAWTYYAVPAGLTPNPTLERLFAQTLLSRAQTLIQSPTPPDPGARWSEASQILMALTRIEPLIVPALPDLSAGLQESKQGIAALLSQGDQQRVNDTLADPPPKKSFNEQVETYDKLADAGRRESGIALAILNAADTENLQDIETAAAKIDDQNLRIQLLSRVYFTRSQRALKDKKLEEARRLAAKVDELDQRAYLYSQIASDSIKQTRNDSQAREMLDDVIDALAKAPNTEIKARAQLAVAYLFSTFDPNRGISVLGDAVQTMNRVESMNLTGESVRKRIEGKAFGFYTALQTPGFNPEAAFREIGKVDFDGTLYLASNLTDKSLRVMTTLALAEQCLKNQPVPKPKESKPLAAKP
jgi:hypothetical protein